MITSITCQENWSLIAQGCGISFLCVIASIVFAILNVHSFLAKNSPVEANVLVVEGWLPDYAIQAAIAEFRKGSYCKLITIGGPLPRGFYLSQYKTFAELSAATLVALGFDTEKLVAVSEPYAAKNRTYGSAMELSQWLSTSNLQVKSLNLYTLGTHARRSWIVFKKVFAPEITVGIIAVEPLGYQPKSWWKSSEGIRTVISELIAYLYVRFSK